MTAVEDAKLAPIFSSFLNYCENNLPPGNFHFPACDVFPTCQFVLAKEMTAVTSRLVPREPRWSDNAQFLLITKKARTCFGPGFQKLGLRQMHTTQPIAGESLTIPGFAPFKGAFRSHYKIESTSLP